MDIIEMINQIEDFYQFGYFMKRESPNSVKNFQKNTVNKPVGNTEAKAPSKVFSNNDFKEAIKDFNSLKSQDFSPKNNQAQIKKERSNENEEIIDNRSKIYSVEKNYESPEINIELEEKNFHNTSVEKVRFFGVNSPKIFVMGSYPSENNIRKQLAFCDDELDFLNKWLSSIGIDVENDVFYSKLISEKKSNKTSEIPNLKKPYEILESYKPSQAILVCGSDSARFLLGKKGDITHFRKQNPHYIDAFPSIPIIVTYPPEYMVNYKSFIRVLVWQDLLLLKKFLKKD